MPTLSRLVTSSPRSTRVLEQLLAFLGVEVLGADHVHDHASDREAAAVSSAMPSPVSCTGISSSTVTRWIAVRLERRSW